MSLPAYQQRVLDVIESTLQRREPRLASMFAMFTRLNTSEGAPRTERLNPPPWWMWRRRKRARVPGRAAATVRMLLLVPLAVLMAGAMFLGMNSSRERCTPTGGPHGLVASQPHVKNCPAASGFQGFGHGP